MASIRQILERRESIRVEMAALNERANGDGSLPGEAQTRWNALAAEADALNAQEQRQATLDDMTRRTAGTPVTGSGDDRLDREIARVGILDTIRAQLGATDAGAGRAREVSAELARRSGRAPEGLFFHMGASGAPTERRTFSTTAPVGGPGASLIQTDVSPNLIDRLRERSVVRQAGATVLTGLQGNLNIPRLKASATASWVAEGSAITATDPQTDYVALTPKHVGGIVNFTRNMVQQPSVDVSRMVEDDLAKLIATAVDQAAIVGGGSNAPSGLLAAGSGITVVSGGTNGAAPSWQNVIALIGSVDQSNALAGALGFVTNAKAVKAMRTTLKTTGDTASNFIMADANTLAGYPVASTQTCRPRSRRAAARP